MFFTELENQSHLGEHSSHSKKIKTSLQNDPFDNILYFASEYLKRTFETSCHMKLGPVRYGPVMKYLLNTVQHILYYTSKYSKRTFKKSQMKSALSIFLLYLTSKY